MDFRAFWARQELPSRPPRQSLFELPHDWGFHIFALGIHLMDQGVAERVEFWDYAADRRISYHASGVLRIRFLNEADLRAYLDRYGPPDLFINYGQHGQSMLKHLAGQCFRVHVPALRGGVDRVANVGAECYLVDSEPFLDARSLLYVPVVNTNRIYPTNVDTTRDFIYLAGVYEGKRHDLLFHAVRNSPLTGHLHPVDGSRLDLTGTRITTSNWDERDVVELLRTSRIAVYPGDRTSNPAAIWECVAAGLPIVVNRKIEGGQHLVVPGVTGEFASDGEFREVMQEVLARRHTYRPREYFDAHWDTVTMLERYLAFFVRMGWSGPLPS